VSPSTTLVTGTTAGGAIDTPSGGRAGADG
jgi:hypothetical protein